MAGTTSATPNLTYENITITETQPDGSVLWKLTASLATYDQDRISATLEKIEGEFYDPEKHVILTLAASGSVFPREKRLELQGQVEVESGYHRLRLTADRVEWLPEQQLLTARGSVVLSRLPDTAVAGSQALVSPTRPPTEGTGAVAPDPVWTATGERLTVNFKTNQAQLANPDSGQRVTAQSPQPPIDLLAQTLTWDIGAQTVRAEGTVEAKHLTEGVILTGAQLTSQIPPRDLTMTGQAYARVAATGLELTANRMSWVVNTSILQANGNVRYQQPGQDLSVTGESATANWQTNTVAVKGSSVTTQLTLP